jgi:hypothetical protein
MDSDDNPFLSALEMLFGAQVHMASGRERQAVLDPGTAIEMVVTSVLRAVGRDRESLDGARGLRADFRGRFEHHLPLALGDGRAPAVDLDDARATWMARGYALRNAVVHQGLVPHPDRARRPDFSAEREGSTRAARTLHRRTDHRHPPRFPLRTRAVGLRVPTSDQASLWSCVVGVRDTASQCRRLLVAPVVIDCHCGRRRRAR